MTEAGNERKRFVFHFTEGSAEKRSLLGGKGANLAEMLRIGLPVPPGFTISTEACLEFLKRGEQFLEEVWGEIRTAMTDLEKETGKNFGGKTNPLLVSVRSGAAVSMPGMMDTILNLGLNADSVKALGTESGDERFALDSYRRFIQMFSNVVLGMDGSVFENVLHQVKKDLKVSYDFEIPASSWKGVISRYLKIVEQETGEPFPDDPWVQLEKSVEAVFLSWKNPRAITYRRINKIPDDLGTAVNVMTMVFGNLGEDCGTGVCFTRNPSTGEKKLYGEFLVNAQGEDVVAGIRTPHPIDEFGSKLPEADRELHRIADLLEKHYRDVQDIEFTVERGKLYMLQTRNAKRTARAAVKSTVDMYNEGSIDAATAVSRVTPDQVEQLLHKQIDPDASFDIAAKGLPASPGAAVGIVIFDADEAEKVAQSGQPVILVRPETTPDDIHGLYAAQGVLTSRGGMTSHAAVVARGLGKPCVSGCESVVIDVARGVMIVGDKTLKKGDILTIDGSKGHVIFGEVPLVQPSFTDDFRELLDIADSVSTLEVWANADTPEDAKRARSFGAKGIGLCRTEHMFMATDRLPVVQEMILARDRQSRVKALDRLKVMQKEDFRGIFRVMDGLPVTIRLLDPPLHEFLPKEHELRDTIASIKTDSEASPEELVHAETVLARVLSLQENNPMLGFRGCRLGLVYPEIYEMQIAAIIEAACELKKEGIDVKPDIMMPLVGTREEMKRLLAMVKDITGSIITQQGLDDLQYLVGTMIEVPRAALVAGEIAEFAEFFSFGTNDLTQTTFGYSRDDAEGKFLAQYVNDGVLPDNPFHVLDREGVGRLMTLAVAEGRQKYPELQIGICGEHGGNPQSIVFCHELGLNYVSCSPFRVPVARLSAAHSKLGLLD
ncbi:MAG: pyruvate, phosphate dikinase [Thermovirgaceae bacterium]|jgi:pyruvate,orthophosphate dikinase|nr:pyruvate, phosphate dikinase [Synergistales bacterium]MDI9392654.1 pyruvate, phosphate dikinase [Synergistota bacterium]MDY0178299.1 pyruvate, phosphate dikinase [Synergistaceae bacterium]HRW87383.1 pyruvate, phosphate dikinase [Thermovirgaceae bacterium]MDD4023012.1 pyruvate, phosphate dikinase [Synergistales bacterium]